MAKTTKKAAAAKPAKAETHNPVLVFNPASQWDGVKANALSNTGSNRGKWLAAMQKLAGQPKPDVEAALAENMPAQAKAGSQHPYTVGMWLGWAAKVNIISWQ